MAMNRSEYLETIEGQRRELRKRRQKQQFFLIAKHEPKAKGRITDDVIEFQRHISGQMDQFGRRAYRSRVVLEIDFFSHQNDPPAVHTLAKNYMDLLQKPVDGCGIERRRLLLTDDRQIDVLIVNYHLRKLSEPEIHLRVNTVANFTQDLALLKRIRDNGFSDADGYRSKGGWDEMADVHADESLDDAMRSLRDWEQNRALIEAKWGVAAFESMHYMNVVRAQELYLRTFEPKVRDLFLLLAPLISETSGMERLNTQMRDMVITPPFMLDLAHAPVPGAGKDVFKTNVGKALAAFKAKHTLLFPLRTTVGVTLICVPPKNHSVLGKEQYVDLDNLARYVIPAVHEVLRPPSDAAYAFDVPAIKDRNARSWHAERLEALKRTPKHSVIQYQIVRLPRMSGDPDNGLVRLALQRGGVGEGLWRQMDRIIDKWDD